VTHFKSELRQMTEDRPR